MWKLKTDYGHIRKSYDIYDLWKFIMSNTFSYEFYKGYQPMTKNEFLRAFFKETKNWQDYILLYKKLNKVPTLNEYLKSR